MENKKELSDMEKQLTEVRLNEIVFDEGVYPRENGHDPALVQVYARDIEQIEAEGKYISVNAENVLLDGRHRMLAYKKNADGNDVSVKVWRYPVSTDLESLKLACLLQDKGKALADNDRVAIAKKLYGLGLSQKDIAVALSVSPPTVSQWLSRTIKEEKDRQRKKVIEMWMACYTQEEIAEKVGITHPTVIEWTKNFVENLEAKLSTKSNFQDDDFDAPIYNIWKTQTKSNSVNHFGNSEERWLENLLYLYTNPFDVIVDPFAGGGSTIDVCKRRGRRYFVSDRKPIVEREDEIRQHDLTDGLPELPRWKDVKLVYLDPPYWKQAEGRYSQDAQDLANMPLEEFNKTLSSIILNFAKKLKGYDDPKYIALIIQPTQWKSPNREYVDHVMDMIRLVNLPVEMRYSVPYESQQCTAQMVEWAKENKRTLVLTREIVVWRVS